MALHCLATTCSTAVARKPGTEPGLLIPSVHSAASLFPLIPKVRPLYTPVQKSNLGDRVLGEVEKDSFVTLPGKGGHIGFCLRKLCVLTQEDLMRGFITMVQRWGLQQD